MRDDKGSESLTVEELYHKTEALMKENGVSSVYDAQQLPESADKNYLLVLLSLLYRQVQF